LAASPPAVLPYPPGDLYILPTRSTHVVRDFRASDLPTIQDIGNRAWRSIYRMYRESFGEELFGILMPASDTVKGDQIEAHCAAHPDWVVICEEGSRIVGFATFSIHEARAIGEIGNNAVDPECGLKGIGQQMYAEVIRRFRALGMRFARVTTGLDWAHAPARRAYERAGFGIRNEDVTYHMKL
jgi:ribosomal protein S18 acetylase RimI-like enzyme